MSHPYFDTEPEDTNFFPDEMTPAENLEDARRSFRLYPSPWSAHRLREAMENE